MIRYRLTALFVGVVLAFLPSMVRAEMFAGIEIGSKGIKFTVVDAQPAADGNELKQVASDSATTSLVAGLAKTGSFTPEALKETSEVVQKYLTKAEKDHSVKPENIFVVGSSGIFSPIAKEPEKVKAKREELAQVILDATKVKMDFIDAKREAELSVRGMIPVKYRKESLLIDIGGGNTKGGFFDASGNIVTMAVDYGSASFAAKISAEGGDFAQKAKQLCKSTLIPELRKQFSQAEEFQKRTRIYLSGGAIWATMTLTNFDEKKAYVPITIKNFDALEARLLIDPTAFPMPDLSSIRDEKLKTSLSKEIDRVKGVYKDTKQLLAGVEILKALSGELNMDKDKKVYFVRDGYLGWITAYIAEKVNP
jgi:hypothetical protein